MKSCYQKFLPASEKQSFPEVTKTHQPNLFVQIHIKVSLRIFLLFMVVLFWLASFWRGVHLTFCKMARCLTKACEKSYHPSNFSLRSR